MNKRTKQNHFEGDNNFYARITIINEVMNMLTKN